ncbi:MAG: alpha-ketoacid dehydrogenase subunit beta [Armatimonadia bacterium]|nr:alpha-ketoacid dehydrogenase subunit beta [Armatimonadia bacterium]
MERELFTSWALREALAQEMRRDETVVLLGEDIAEYGGAFKVTEGLVHEFGPTRVRNTPISENGFVGVAVGAAMTGLRPVTEIMFMDFVALAMDQLVNHAAKFHYIYGDGVTVPMVLRLPAGGGRGYGATHSQTLDSWFISVPGLKVVAPWSPADAKGLLTAAIRDDNPVVFIEHKLLYPAKGPVPEGEHVVEIGKANRVREGSDLTIISYSKMMDEALRAADALAEAGVECDVIDLRSLQPLDDETLAESVARTGRAILIEEGVRQGGVMAEVACRVMEAAFDYLEAPLIRLGGGFAPIPCAEGLERTLMPTAADVVAAAHSILA